jgi:uncharacterized OB-fold protein
MGDISKRILPPLTAANRAFWTGGLDGQLLIGWCEECARWIHPPRQRCREGDHEVVPRAASGRGTVFTFTVNEHAYNPAVPPPYVIAIVELEDQADLRLITNLVGCAPDQLRCGLPVRVRFEAHDIVAVPLFEPDPTGGRG